MNRKLLYLTTIILTLAGCASEDYVGNEELHEANEKGRPVSFDLTSAPQTRSERYGAEAASDLNNNFVVWGDKTMSDNSKQTVFDNYQVNYVTNSANTTTSNSAGWEYVGYTSKKNVGQTIKYWDFSADKYNFFAYSLGKGVEVTPATDPKTYTYATSTNMTSTGYTLSGSVDELAACYISDKVEKTNMSATNTQVSLKFRRLGAKVKIALYETIPGYSVKDVRFYRDGSIASSDAGYGTTAYLYAANYAEATPTILSHTDGEGTISVRYDSETPTLGWTPTDSGKENPYISFGNSDPTSTDWGNWAGREYEKQAEGKYIGRSSVEATGPKDFISVLPSPSVATPTDLKLKVDYTLLSRDDSKEEIHVTGATATVPAQFAVWKPNCAYTYLFKISDNTNGSTGKDILGLSPITLDAVYVNAEGQQETITTVTEPSITTYQKGADHTTSEYKAGDIYVVVHDGTDVIELRSSNAKLYMAEAIAADDNHPVNITEATVANAIANAITNPTAENKDANGNIMTVTEITPSILNFVSSIPGSAMPDGNEITIKCAKFAAAASTTYVFQYTKMAPVLYADEIEYNTAKGTSLTAEEFAALTTEQKTKTPAEYQYKVIKVGSGS